MIAVLSRFCDISIHVTVGEDVSKSAKRAAILRPSSEMTCVYFIVVRVAEAILSSRRGDNLAVHRGLVPVAESVKSAALNPELFEEGIEVSLPTPGPRPTSCLCPSQRAD
jgi:hypothetical protein